jgi:hypothetical protein
MHHGFSFIHLLGSKDTRMTLLHNDFWNKLQAVYGDNYREACPKDTGYTYKHLWSIATGKTDIPLILEKYLDMKLSRKRPKNGVKRKAAARGK